MVIRARLVHKLLDGILLCTYCIALIDRVPSHQETSQEQLSSLESASHALPQRRHGGAAEGGSQVS
jgi:hypothetical protein